MSTTNYKDMSGPELVAAFNAMVARADTAGQNTIKNVKRFKSRDAGVKRCKWLAEKLGLGNGSNGVAKPDQQPKNKKPSKAKLDRWYGIGAGSLRDKLRLRLQAANGPITRRECELAVYGQDTKGAIRGVIEGLEVMLRKHNAPLKVQETKDDKGETCYEIVHA